MTDAEAFLWTELRRKNIECHYRRQHPIGPFIADFVCLRHHLIIECDGFQHGERPDVSRDRYVGVRGWTVIRFWNHEVLGDIESVTATIFTHCHPQ